MPATTTRQPLASHRARVPLLIRDYFGVETIATHGHPIISSTYAPGRGWKRSPGSKRVSLSWLRKLRREEGVTDVAVSLDGRDVDFSIVEVERYQRKELSAPVFGGNAV